MDADDGTRVFDAESVGELLSALGIDPEPSDPSPDSSSSEG